jgi:hypothetical protein
MDIRHAGTPLLEMDDDRKETRSWFLATIVSLVFSILTVTFFLFFETDRFSVADFPDRLNYIDRLNVVQQLEYNAEIQVLSSLFSYLSAEIGWQLVFSFSLQFFDSPETIMNVLGVFSLALFGLFCLRNKSTPYYYLLFLLNPLVIDLVLGQARSACAMAILFAGFMGGKRTVLIVCIILAQSIHFTSIIFVAIFLAAQFIVRLDHASLWQKTTCSLLVGLGLSLSIVIAADLFFIFTDNHRTQSAYGSSTWLFSLFWILLLPTLIMFAQKRCNKSWEYHYVISILALFFVFTVAETYNARFLAMAFPILMNSMSLIRGNIRILVTLLLSFYQGVQYYYYFII